MNERKEKFTPGPWKVMGPAGSLTRPGIDGDVNGRKRSIILVGAEENQRGVDTEANAALIAAAPDMYAALEELLDSESVSIFSSAMESESWKLDLKEWETHARSALAKARGES